MRIAFLVAAGLVLAGLVAAPAPADPPGPPELTVPGDLTVEPENSAGARVRFTASALDWKGRAVPVACEPTSGSRFPFGRTTIACVAEDRRGETATGSFRVTVERLFRPVEGARLMALRRTRFSWFPVEGARLYNLQLWRLGPSGWRKIASRFPTGNHAHLGPSWLYKGDRYRLRQSSYAWFVWPWLGSRYGSPLGVNSFSVRES